MNQSIYYMLCRQIVSFLLILLCSSSAFAVTDPDDFVSVDFKEAALSDILFLVAETTGDSFVLSAPDQTLTWVQEDILKTRFTASFLNALSASDLIVQQSEGLFLISNSSTPVVTSRNSLSYYHLRYISVDALKETSEVLYRNRLAINPLEGSRVVLLSGDPSDVRQFVKLLKSIDIPKEPEISVYRFKHISLRSGMSALQLTKSLPQDTYFPDYWNRSIIISGTGEQRNQALEVLARIDIPQDGWVDVLEYIHTTTPDDVINLLTSACGSVNVYRVADDRILLSGLEDDVKKASNIVHQIDGAGLQVKVEAVIAYLTDKEYKELGTRIKISSNNFSFTSLDPLLGNNLSLLSDDFQSFLKLSVHGKDTENHGRIISSPVLTVLNGKSAHLHVGQNVPYLSEANVDKNDGSTTGTSIERKDVGVTFDITPTIDPDGQFVYVKLEQIISQITPSTGLDQTFSDIVFDKQELASSVKIANGDTVFLGGLSVDDSGKYTEKVPFLGYIPILGGLFTYKSEKVENRNLVVSLRVKVLGV